jgi:hypothetical protein
METIEKGIVPIRIGGLGNQMFIVAAAYVAHKESKSPLYIPESPQNNKHNSSNDYNSSIFKYFGTHVPYSQNTFLQTYLHHNPPAFVKWNPKLVQPGTCMTSYFQYYPTLEPYEDDLRILFLQGLKSYFFKINDSYTSCAFLHIRRGDYLTYSDIHYNQGLEYYKQASKLIQKSGVTKIVVVSDDLVWVREQEMFKDKLYELYDSSDELEVLALMSKCTAGAICANSTFSWWGAFLGAHRARNPCIVPKKWISHKIESLFPSEWIII